MAQLEVNGRELARWRFRAVEAREPAPGTQAGARPPRDGPADRRAAAGRSKRATLQRLAALEHEFDGIVDAGEPSQHRSSEQDPEGATSAFERQRLAALIGQARAKLARVNAALRRLDEGSYGRCERCGPAVDSERLAARPTATTCITCAAAARRRMEQPVSHQPDQPTSPARAAQPTGRPEGSPASQPGPGLDQPAQLDRPASPTSQPARPASTTSLGQARQQLFTFYRQIIQIHQPLTTVAHGVRSSFR